MSRHRRLIFLSLAVAMLVALGACGSISTATLPDEAADAQHQSDEQPLLQPAPHKRIMHDKGDEAADEQTVVRPFEDILVYPDDRVVEIRAWTCLEQGFLEQIACSPGTREHESLVVIRAEPSNIHAAMLLAGYDNGRPGQWRHDPETQQLQLIAPEGDLVDVFFRYDAEDGEPIEVSARHWIRDHEREQTFPNHPWVFGGSKFRDNPEWMGPGEHYVADMTGSIIGLVTFGDEVIGFKEVISDRAAVHEPEWEVHPERVPAINTEVTVIIRPYDRKRYETEENVEGQADGGE